MHQSNAWNTWKTTFVTSYTEICFIWCKVRQLLKFDDIVFKVMNTISTSKPPNVDQRDWDLHVRPWRSLHNYITNCNIVFSRVKNFETFSLRPIYFVLNSEHLLCPQYWSGGHGLINLSYEDDWTVKKGLLHAL